MTEFTQESFDFPACKRRRVEARFAGGDITSDGGVLLLQQADRLPGLIEAVANALGVPRRRASCTHDLRSLLEAIRRLALDGTELANACVATIRLKLLKIGAVITRNTRRIRFLLSSTYPYQRLFADVAAKLHPT